MSDKRMLVVDAELVKKIDENRGDLSRSEFVNFLIDGQLKEESKSNDGVTREEFRQFQEGAKELLPRSCCAASWSSSSTMDWNWVSSPRTTNSSS